MAFLNPEEIVKKLPLEHGMAVADFGAGVGAFSIPIGKRAEEGMVFAIDVNKELLGKIALSAREAGLENVEVIWGDIEENGGSKLNDKSMDLVVLANVLYQTENKEAVVAEAERVLKPTGFVFVSDWTDSFGGLGPKPDDIAKPEDVKKMFGRRGLTLYNEIEAGDHHYGFLFKRPVKF